MEYIILGVVLFIIIVLVTRIKIVPQAQVYIVERLGTFYAEWSTGPHFLIPFLDRIAKKVSIKDQIVDFKPQSVITKDNVSMQIDTVVFFQVTDAKQYAYGVERPLSAIENLCATTLRNIIGDMVLDETLTSRDRINKQITAILDEATDRWGIKVSRVELKNILPPREIQDSMEKQMKAERESREKILLAEGEKKSKILVAQGEKESQILRAEAAKESEILKAQAEKEAMILRAEAVKEKKRLESEGDAVAISKVQTAKAEALERLNEAKPSENVLKYKALEYFPEIANGRATKIIIPSEIQGIAGLAAGVMETVTDKNITEK
ncbi:MULTISPECIES: SPFH domain-containing protein [Porcipelethomonas]|jgi:regulator of protease activity HflC (stomatin/prohibitin superfamily)|uniref:SPFH domain-containing protein n=1 Tax=Porcipelethomonas TaxID=2981643 RepID=UPI000822FFA9|nr:SPFH domain-containing protein [Porcipelethomonas ammoniilytica]MBS1325040.1 SPFH/Band 7/PHB domain protein [Oscillospiraceae bacterium]MBS6315753.1 SPFH/Band 7/PHB domain protein [Ruminococcus sp.]OLA00770.1 MAG: peptidase [Clostridiales bacterium Nov_37_41]SCJ08404.1 FtsH protease regulator HflK [uncultured Ruminococcus sp.]MCU6720302.1 SPFH domain-containing protein [Porcipelethomonas ammoniilytica]